MSLLAKSGSLREIDNPGPAGMRSTPAEGVRRWIDLDSII